ncbi:hypothetical protein BpHYR1_030340 [Brachionus plicatilis]|uniref:Uncharacterized protein n=1 Tax=Brachionus plicatilis TaxID=10195 RepID=A0A3M7PKX0_BRAPC|nr:hypothetical protein BpHYR1_030340 [Brachionus plicatilis]
MQQYKNSKIQKNPKGFLVVLSLSQCANLCIALTILIEHTTKLKAICSFKQNTLKTVKEGKKNVNQD